MKRRDFVKAISVGAMLPLTPMTGLESDRIKKSLDQLANGQRISKEEVHKEFKSIFIEHKEGFNPFGVNAFYDFSITYKGFTLEEQVENLKLFCSEYNDSLYFSFNIIKTLEFISIRKISCNSYQVIIEANYLKNGKYDNCLTAYHSCTKFIRS